MDDQKLLRFFSFHPIPIVGPLERISRPLIWDQVILLLRNIALMCALRCSEKAFGPAALPAPAVSSFTCYKFWARDSTSVLMKSTIEPTWSRLQEVRRHTSSRSPSWISVHSPKFQLSIFSFLLLALLTSAPIQEAETMPELHCFTISHNWININNYNRLLTIYYSLFFLSDRTLLKIDDYFIIYQLKNTNIKINVYIQLSFLSLPTPSPFKIKLPNK